MYSVPLPPARENRELSRVFKTPRRHRYRRTVAKGVGNSGDFSSSDTDGPGLGFDDSDQDPLLPGGGKAAGLVGGGGGRGSYDPREAARPDGSLRRFLALV